MAEMADSAGSQMRPDLIDPIGLAKNLRFLADFVLLKGSFGPF